MKTSKKIPTYTTLRGLLVAKSKGTAPRGIKAAQVDPTAPMFDATIEFRVGGVAVLSVDRDDFIADALKRLGFVMAKE